MSKIPTLREQDFDTQRDDYIKARSSKLEAGSREEVRSWKVEVR